MWWVDVLAGLVIVLGIYAFISLTGARTRWLSRKTTRTAEELYDGYAEPSRQQRRSAKRHQRQDGGGDDGPGAGPRRS